MLAASSGDEDTADYVLDQLADSPDWRSDFTQLDLNGHGVLHRDVCSRTKPMSLDSDKMGFFLKTGAGLDELVRRLLQSDVAGLSPLSPDKDGRTPLHMAAIAAQLDATLALLEGIHHHSTTQSLQPPLVLHLACHYQKYWCRKLRSDSEGLLPSHWAALRGAPGILERLLQTEPSLLATNPGPPAPFSLLHAAVFDPAFASASTRNLETCFRMSGSLETVELVLKHYKRQGMSCDASPPPETEVQSTEVETRKKAEQPETPKKRPSCPPVQGRSSGSKGTSSSLPLTRDIYGRTPVHIAVQQGFIPILHHLIEEGGKRWVVGRDAGGRSPLFYAAALGESGTGMAEVLLANEARLQDAETVSGDTPLHLAARAGADGLAASLVQSASKEVVSMGNAEGRTPLHEAVGAASPELVKTLLDAGASVWAEDNAERLPVVAGFTPEEDRRKSCVELVVEAMLEANDAAINSSSLNTTHRSLYRRSRPEPEYY